MLPKNHGKQKYETDTNMYEWLVILLIFSNEEEYNMEEGVPLEIERGSWLKSMKMVKVDQKKIKVIAIVTRFLNGFETYFLKKEGNQLKLFNDNVYDTNTHFGYNTFTDILNIINVNFSSKKKLVITLGHGSVFGINYTIKTPDKNLGGEERDEIHFERHRNKSLPKIKLNRNIIIPRYDIFNDSSYILLNTQIAESFKKVFGTNSERKPIDILVMSNCFMQNIFTQHDLHSAVDFFVAPISGISFPGYNIIEAIENLAKTDCNKKAADYFVNQESIRRHRIIQHRDLDDPYRKVIESRWFLQSFQLNTEFMNSFKRNFIKLIDELYKLITKVNESYKILQFIKQSVKDSFKYSKKSLEHLDLIDFRVFIMSLRYNLEEYNLGAERLEDKELLSSIISMINVLNQQKFTWFAGNNFFEDDVNFNDSLPSFGALANKHNLEHVGFGFYLPLDRNEYNFDNIFINKKYMPSLIIGTKYFELVTEITNTPSFN